MKQRVIRNTEYWIKRREEVMASEDNYKRQRELEKIDIELWKIGTVFYDSSNKIPYVKEKKEDANNKAKEGKTVTEYYKHS